MRQFRDAGLDEFLDLIDGFAFTRALTEVHLHHSWRPRQADYRGVGSIQEMWRQHTEGQGWSDIAQHITVAPDGRIWLGRNFNRAPASARGFNGNDRAGPFMVVMIGDFEPGEETPTEAQMEAAIGAIRAVQARFGLPASAFHLHGELSGVTCPGSLDRQALSERIAAFELSRSRTGEGCPFPETMTRRYELLRALDVGAGVPEDMSGAELAHGPEAMRAARAGARPAEADLADYRDHWINLDRGAFSTEGRLTTTRADVDRIFGERLPSEIARAKARGRKLNLVFYAHGGLVSEDEGIGHMVVQSGIWRANDVFPIFFIWETGFWRSIGNLLVGRREAARAARVPAVDWLLEESARRLGGVSIWGVMKTNALLANSDTGGALYAGQSLKKLVDAHGGDLRVHAVGHSAGSIFQAHFLQEFLREKKYGIETLSLLAPAARTDLFKKIVVPLMKAGRIGETTVYTMNDQRERARDPSMGPYGKSLLYLIRGGLEPDRQADILGLEASLRSDPALAEIFGLNGNPAGRNRVIFSGDPGSASEAAQAMGLASDSRSHGGFDDDPMTMNSVLRQVTERIQGEPIEPFRPSRSRAVVGVAVDDLDYLPEALAEPLRALSSPLAPPAAPQSGIGAQPAAAPPPLAPSAASPGTATAGRRRALCIGIDDYRLISPLAGCRNDANRWREALEGLGYQVDVMPQEEATADNLVERIGNFVREARAGDSHVLQFSGHGSQFEDASGDEAAGPGPSDGKDEALCGFDCGTDSGGLVLDDHLRELMNGAASGATLICFLDSCHSGTVTRARLAGERTARSGSRIRVRSFSPNAAMQAAYREIARTAPRLDPALPMREVVFSACLPNQYAFERDGQGDFTRHALQVLRNGGSRPTNSGFINAITRLFGNGSVQTPLLDCQPDAREAPIALGAWA